MPKKSGPEKCASKKCEPKKVAPKQGTVTPSYCIEWSRNQVLLRTGRKGKGESRALKFGPGCAYKDVKRAEAVATKWLEERTTKNTLDTTTTKHI